MSSTSVVAETRTAVRDSGFSDRLNQACDANFHCPPLHKGRLSWIADSLSKKLKKTVSLQTAARWLNGEAKPRRDKNDALANLLGVDPIWLYFGIEQDLTPRERKVRNALADGAVNLIAGLIQMDGGYPAFPDEKDARAQREHVDLYAVIKGANYSFHVTVGTKQDDNWQFVVPIGHENLVVLGVVREAFSFRIFELTEDLIANSGGNTRGVSITVPVSDADVTENEIKSFSQRL